eukprot:208361-Prorocentrum_lima.AAC.1
MIIDPDTRIFTRLHNSDKYDTTVDMIRLSGAHEGRDNIMSLLCAGSDACWQPRCQQGADRQP